MIETTPVVSIIIPAYNEQDIIASSLESIVN
jgi:glycosyltransferase involved in cell wall biosynthesis